MRAYEMFDTTKKKLFVAFNNPKVLGFILSQE